MNLLKIFKVLEVMWPFIKEILLDKDTPAPDRRKKGMALVLTLAFIFVGSGWTMVHAYVTPFLPPNQTSTPSDTDRDDQWVRFLEDRLTENLGQITQLRREVATLTVNHKRELARANQLQVEIDELIQDFDHPVEERVTKNRILDRLESLRNVQ